MSRSISSTALSALMAQQTTETFLVLLTIEHDDLANPIRVVNNTEDVVSGGDTYTAFPFEIVLPDDTEENFPRATLRIDNVDRALGEAVRTISSPAVVTIEVVLASSPDTIEVSFAELELVNVTYDAMMVEGELTMEGFLSEPFPGDLMSPTLFPGVF